MIINILTTLLQFSILKTLLNVACGMWHVAKLGFRVFFPCLRFTPFCSFPNRIDNRITRKGKVWPRNQIIEGLRGIETTPSAEHLGGSRWGTDRGASCNSD